MTQKKFQLSSVYGEQRFRTLSELADHFQKFNREHGITYGLSNGKELSAVIVYDSSNWSRPYSEESRSYRVTSQSGKAFFDGMIGYSIFGDCLDGTDRGVRLDWYREWKIERIYLEGSVEQ